MVLPKSASIVLALALALVSPSTAVALSPADSAASNAEDNAEHNAEIGRFLAGMGGLHEDHGHLLRLYRAYFKRDPDIDGAAYWIDQLDRCRSLNEISTWFAAGEEFERRYRSTGNQSFVEQVYRNILERNPDDEGLLYWTAILDGKKLDRAGVVLHVSLSSEFGLRHSYDFDDVAPRRCHQPDDQGLDRSVHVIDDPGSSPLVTIEPGDSGSNVDVYPPAAIVERMGFHQSSHPGALPMSTPDNGVPVRWRVMASRNRGTSLTGAVDIAVEPATAITAPVTGTVARAGNYRLYCRYTDGYVVINPDSHPDLEVKVLHVQDVAVEPGQRVEVGDLLAAHATKFRFVSQIDALATGPAWPHVHIEVVDPSIPRRSSSGGGC